MKKIISIILTVCITVTMAGTVALAKDISNDSSVMEARKNEILKAHREKIIEIERSADDNIAVRTRDGAKSDFDLKLEIQAETVTDLNAAGYEAYDVNPQTFQTVEEKLNTDLESIGLKNDGAYIITINEEFSAYPDALISDPFSYTYGGTTYSLRWMTIRASDDPLMGKVSEEDLLDSPTQQLLINCLDTAINAYLSSIKKPLGTVASILGLSIGDFGPPQHVRLKFVGATNWTRRYTQVWSNYDQAWANGCFVEEMTTFSHTEGEYYDKNLNSYASLDRDEHYETDYSDYFNDWNWRQSRAVMGYLNSYIYKDSVGDAEYEYGDEIIIRHRHNF